MITFQPPSSIVLATPWEGCHNLRGIRNQITSFYQKDSLAEIRCDLAT